MKNITTTTFALLLALSHTLAQDLTQTIRGTLVDVDSRTPLIGATVQVLNIEPTIGAITDVNGRFRLSGVPVGRVTIKLSYIGYETAAIPNVLVNSGKEVILDLTMQESTIQMDELVVTATTVKGEAVNEMAMVSARSISTEETSRFPATLNDPSRVISNFAGVATTQDGGNDIIVRGNSPKYMQWRLEGVQITNPNHFADQSAVGGGISALNNNLLAASDFYTGAFTAEFGDVLAGVYDVRMRAGNNERFESTFGFGLLGTDFTVEGPLKKGYGGSYLANYRYSTVSLISAMGLVDLNGVPKFQDAAYKVVLPTGQLGTFSLFGLMGYSEVLIEDITPEIYNTPGERGGLSYIQEDYDQSSFLVNTGLNHSIQLNKKSFINTTLLYSSEGIRDKVYEWEVQEIFDTDGAYVEDSTFNKTLNLNSELTKSTIRGATTFHSKINARHKLQVGTKYALFDYEFEQSQFVTPEAGRFSVVDFKEHISTVRNFVSWKWRATDHITVVGGVHNMNVLYNQKSTIEPRLATNIQITPTLSMHAGYGLHSTMESVHNYFARVEQEDGSFIEPNKDLDLLKAHHYVLGFEKRLSPNSRLQLEVYYQDLYDLPVANSDTSYYATINEGLEFTYVDLVNEGVGKNYGVELTLERFFHNNYYYLVNGSLFESKYKSLEGVERNTQYNGNYLVNVLVGKEFPGLGKKKNRTLAINMKMFVGGGKRIVPLLRDADGNVIADPESGNVWDYDKAYNDDIEDPFSLIFSASYKWNNPRATHELYLNLENVTDHKGKISEYFDASQPGNVGYLTQFGFFPNLQYKVYF